MISKLKLGVDVVSAHNVFPKDGQRSVCAYVELHFDGQKFRTTIKENDVNPVWNESFYFNINDPANLHNLALEAYVYNKVKGIHSRSFLGKLTLTREAFFPYSDALLLYYPLKKRFILSRVKGELGLKVYITNSPSIKSSHQLPAMESLTNSDTDTNDTDQQSMEYAADDMKPEPQQPTIVRMYSTSSSSSSSQPVDYQLKETSPYLGGGQIVGGRVIRSDKPSSTYDLVEKMLFLFVRVVKARDLPSMDITGSLDPYVEVRIGNYRGTTKHFEKKQNPEWNEVFAFSMEGVQASTLKVVVKDKDFIKDDFLGSVRFDLHEIPTRVPPDSRLAPEWYQLEGKKGEKSKSELMLAVWIGTQADEAFPDAWHSDAIAPVDISASVYHVPRLWYVQINIIEAQDLIPTEKNRFPDVYVKAQIGSQVLKTKTIQAHSLNPQWNEDLLFVIAEPFEDTLVLSVEDCVGPNKDDVLGKVVIPLNTVDKFADDRAIHARWFNLQKPVVVDVDQFKKDKFSSRIQLHVCLHGGYHVLDESTHYSIDLRPTAEQLWRPSIGVLELGILSVDGLHPMKIRDGKGTSDMYCVAKYGHKWVRSRTIINSLSPKYNEQYTWEVYDLDTVLTVGVFDNIHLGGKGFDPGRDLKIGKVRILISTLEMGRVYTHFYPLFALYPSGVKKMGGLHLAIRFSCTSLVNMMNIYSHPVLPKKHYIKPSTVVQFDMLRHQAVNIVAARLNRAEPPLRKEVVEYMSDADSHLWSMPRSKAKFFRLMPVFSGLLAVNKWFGDVCKWKNPITTVLVHVAFVMLVCFPGIMLPTVFLFILFEISNFHYQPRYPPYMNTQISYAEAVHPGELDEEFDTFPTSRNPELVCMRYDRLRSVAGRIQNVLGNIATKRERMQALLSCQDPRATAIFITFCFVSALVLYVTPFQVVAVIAGFFFMRHPRFRHRLPSVPINFFCRLPVSGYIVDFCCSFMSYSRYN